jgi:phosphohistidine phosphatase
MKRLLLLRHAKSSQDDARDDKARPLNARGRRDAPAMGAHIHKQLWLPDCVLCSSARRTRETWAGIAPELDASPRVEFEDALYLASAKRIVSLVREVGVREAGDEVRTLLVIGHNPGMEEAAAMLARKPADKSEAALLEKIAAKFPTCALAVLDFEVARWADVAAHTGALAAFVRPKEL